MPNERWRACHCGISEAFPSRAIRFIGPFVPAGSGLGAHWRMDGAFILGKIVGVRSLQDNHISGQALFVRQNRLRPTFSTVRVRTTQVRPASNLPNDDQIRRKAARKYTTLKVRAFRRGAGRRRRASYVPGAALITLLARFDRSIKTRSMSKAARSASLLLTIFGRAKGLSISMEHVPFRLDRLRAFPLQ